MTRHETAFTPDIADKDLVIATDLDGTFLGGTEDERARFYKWIRANRDRIGLIFVTGRDPGFINKLTKRDGVPRPDYVVADVGTTVATVDVNHVIAPIPELEEEIARAWGNATATVQHALRGLPGLTPQSTGFRHRMSFDMDPAQFDPRAVEVIEKLGLDALVSADRFFDVLPRGVSKGPTLMRLLDHVGVEAKRTLVAGDTLNDLSMLQLGLPAVAVGGSEPALIDRVSDLEHMHIAKGHGVAGIAEAILAFGMFTAKQS
jgi:HAD superfamily hydrolase (TIGR01484 family)